MKNEMLYTLGVSILITLSACTENNDSNTEPSSQTLNLELQSNLPEKHVVPELPTINNNMVIDSANDIVMAEAKEKESLPSSAALGAVGGYRSLQPENRFSAKRMIIRQESVLQSIRQASEDTNRESYEHYDDSPVKLVSENPVSTFSIDVDTGAYSNVRRIIKSGRLPAQDAVRVEEMINYFSYDYPASKETNVPFVVMKEIAPSPWNKENYILHLGIKAHDVKQNQLPNSNLVFLVDVSGSMQSENKLELLKTSLKLLSKQLSEKDKVSIVVYAGASGVVLNPTSGNQTAVIQAALAQLTAGGSTNGAAGIELAYSLAQQEYIEGGINRVIIATDGDFNVGTVNHEQLIDLIEEKRKSGISLSTLGFGTGNYNDKLMEQLADKGNGNYAYIDNLNEAQKVLVDEMSSTLLTVAKDVKIQIEFNPDVVSEYRLIGYENRHLNREDFNNDKVDAGEIGAGHTVTALYEITLADSQSGLIEPLRYKQDSVMKKRLTDEIAFLKLRYKEPSSETSQLLEWTVKRKDIIDDINKTSDSFRFSAAVAAFSQGLRGGKYIGKFSYQDIMTLAQSSRGIDRFGYRGEFLSLVNLAQSISVVAAKNNASVTEPAL
jgi:Ca-activated chloride channel homolog